MGLAEHLTQNMGSRPILPQGMKVLASPLFIWLALSFAVIVSSRHFLVETEDGTAEYSGNMDNPDEYQKAADYSCWDGIPPCIWTIKNPFATKRFKRMK